MSRNVKYPSVVRHVRKLEFDVENPNDQKRVSLLYFGFVMGGNTPQPKGMEVTRREARILDKFEDIILIDDAVPDTKAPDVQIAFRVKTGSVALLLEQPEFELLKRYFEQTPWTVKVSRSIVEISDWLSSIQMTDDHQG